MLTLTIISTTIAFAAIFQTLIVYGANTDLTAENLTLRTRNTNLLRRLLALELPPETPCGTPLHDETRRGGWSA